MWSWHGDWGWLMMAPVMLAFWGVLIWGVVPLLQQPADARRGNTPSSLRMWSPVEGRLPTGGDEQEVGQLEIRLGRRIRCPRRPARRQSASVR